jgi:hypothetical protein
MYEGYPGRSAGQVNGLFRISIGKKPNWNYDP